MGTGVPQLVYNHQEKIQLLLRTSKNICRKQLIWTVSLTELTLKIQIKIKIFCKKVLKIIRPISIGQLNTLLLHLKPINLVVFKGTYCSRLDAFSGYPFRT